MGVYKLSGAGAIKTGRTVYTSMNVGNQFGRAMVPIASFTANGTSGYVLAFSNIPQTYQDLMIVGNSRCTVASSLGYPYTRLNDNDASIYSDTNLIGNGASISSSRNSSTSVGRLGVEAGGSSTAGIFGSLVIHILNYANTSTFKTILSRSAADLNGSGETRLVATLFRSTSAVSSVRLSDEIGGNFASGSTFNLYGIKAA